MEETIDQHEYNFNSKWNQEISPVDNATQDLNAFTEPQNTDL